MTALPALSLGAALLHGLRFFMWCLVFSFAGALVTVAMHAPWLLLDLFALFGVRV